MLNDDSLDWLRSSNNDLLRSSKVINGNLLVNKVVLLNSNGVSKLGILSDNLVVTDELVVKIGGNVLKVSNLGLRGVEGGGK